MDKVVDDENLRYRKMIVDLDQAGFGPLAVVGSPFLMSETPATVRSAAPRIGEHSALVMRRMLGYTEDRIAELKRNKVIRIWNKENTHV